MDKVCRYIEIINDVYQEYNIHKSLILCNYDDIYMIEEQLNAYDYSVCTTRDIEKFCTTDRRILLLGEDELYKLNKIYEEIDVMEINLVITLGLLDVRTYVKNVKHIFISSNINVQVIE